MPLLKPVVLNVIRNTNNDKVSRAKERKIEDLYDDRLRQVGKVLKGWCPFHQDTGNPNFMIYTETNTFFCFRCNEGGDVIKYYMKLHGCSFQEAVEELSQ